MYILPGVYELLTEYHFLLPYRYYLVLTISIACHLFAMLMSFGYAMILNVAIRDIDYAYLISKLGFLRYYASFVPFCVATLLVSVAFSIKVFMLFKLSFAVPMISFLMLSSVIPFVCTYALSWGDITYDGILKKFGHETAAFPGWEENKQIANMILEALFTVYQEDAGLELDPWGLYVKATTLSKVIRRVPGAMKDLSARGGELGPETQASNTSMEDFGFHLQSSM